MRIAADQVQAHRALLPIGGATPLSKPVQGLSARRMEELFDLPTGAWHQRHLYGLRLLVDGYSDFGLRRGDLLLIEPGGRQPRGNLVICRRSDGETALRRVPDHAAKAHSGSRGHEPMAHETTGQDDESLWLPLKEATPQKQEPTVGVVISVARLTQSGVLRALFPRRRRPSTRASLPQSPQPQNTEHQSHDQIETGLQNLRQQDQKWRVWIQDQELALGQGSNFVRQWRQLGCSLKTLIDCIEVARTPRLAIALSREARAIVRTMHGEIARSRMTVGTKLCA
jgi:hypothetical protein